MENFDVRIWTMYIMRVKILTILYTHGPQKLDRFRPRRTCLNVGCSNQPDEYHFSVHCIHSDLHEYIRIPIFYADQHRAN